MRKTDIRGIEKELVSSKVKFTFKGHSSGTTGSPLRVFRDYHSINVENVTLRKQWLWANCNKKALRAVLRAHNVASANATEPPFWIYSPADRQLLMSSFHLAEQYIPHYIEKLRHFKPEIMQTFPSSAYEISKFMQENKEQPLKLKAVFTQSETLYPFQRELINQFIGPVYDFYGNAERVAWIGDCEHSNYHIMQDYSIVELVPNDDGQYEIVGTTLHNSAMPFIRYGTGDIVEIEDGDKCPCGRNHPTVKSIVGRQDDVIITPSGRKIGRLDTTFQDVDHLVGGQIIQEKLDELKILIVTSDGFNSNDEDQLRSQLNKRFGDEIKLKITEVEALPRTKGGKFKLIVSKLT